MGGKVWKPQEDDEKRIGNKSDEKKKRAKSENLGRFERLDTNPVQYSSNNIMFIPLPDHKQM